MRLRDFVHVEFARAWQEEQGAARVDPEAVALTRADADLPPASDGPGRLLSYAKTLLDLRLDAGEGQSTVTALAGALTTMAIVVPLLGGLAGGAMLEAALPPPDARPVNVFHLVAEGILLPGAFLVWTLFVVRLLGRHTARLHWVAWLLGALRGRALSTDVGRLGGRVLRRSGVAAELFAAWSHTFWIAALVVFLGLGFWRFAFADYVFAWSSTLPVTAQGVESFFGGLATPVDALPGIDPPSSEQVRVSEYGSLDLSGGAGGGYVDTTGDPLRDQALRKAWWSLMLAIVAFWGLAPRVLGLIAARWSVRRGIRRALEDPTSQLILDALAPPPAVESGAPEQLPLSDAPAAGPAPIADVAQRAGRGLDVVVFATEAPGAAVLADRRLDRLGLSGTVRTVPTDDDDDAMDAVVAALAGAEAPEGAVVVFAFGAIPDALKQEFLGGVVGALGAEAPAHVLLTGVDRFVGSARASGFDARRAAWTGLAARVGLPADRVHLDLDP